MEFKTGSDARKNLETKKIRDHSENQGKDHAYSTDQK
jgi:hypothetical protein